MLADVHFEEHDGMPVARIRGEVDMSNVEQMSMTLQRAVTQESPGLVVDFSETGYLDSAGLQFIFDLGKRVRDRGQRLYLVVPHGAPVAGLLEIARVEALAERFDSLDAAVERLRQHGDDIPEKKRPAEAGRSKTSS